MTFAEPYFLLLLLLVPLLAAGAFLATRQRKMAWEQLVAPRLRRKLAAPASPLSRWLSLGAGLLGFTFLIIALAQPIAGEQEVTSLVKGRNLIIAIDASRSMLTRDVAPDRLTVARTAVYELLDRFPEDRIGLLAFAGTAAVQAPLTVDHNALRETLDQLDVNNVPAGGSNLADAVNLATRAFRETGQNTHGLIVISDGELHEGELDDATHDATIAGVFVVAIGIGTRDGDFIPDSSEKDNRFRDRNGKPVLSRLNSEPLRNLARDTKGIYLEGAGGDFTDKIDSVINSLDAFEGEGRVQKTPIPRFQWFLVPAMILMIASLLLRFLWAASRPKAVAASPVTALIIATAFLGTAPKVDAWSNPLDGFLGSQALKKGNPDKALEHFEKAAKNAEDDELAKIRFGQGEAAYESLNYARAAEFYSNALLSSNKTLQRDAHSKLANTLYLRTLEELKEMKRSQNFSKMEALISYLQDAIDHYDSALEIDPKHKPSEQNRQIAQEALEKLKQAQQQKQEQQQDPNQQQESNEEQELSLIHI